MSRPRIFKTDIKPWFSIENWTYTWDNVQTALQLLEPPNDDLLIKPCMKVYTSNKLCTNKVLKEVQSRYTPRQYDNAQGLIYKGCWPVNHEGQPFAASWSYPQPSPCWKTDTRSYKTEWSLKQQIYWYSIDRPDIVRGYKYPLRPLCRSKIY